MIITKEQALQLISQKNYRQLSLYFLETFNKYFWQKNSRLSEAELASLDNFCRTFLDIFCSVDFFSVFL